MELKVSRPGMASFSDVMENKGGINKKVYLVSIDFET